MNPPGHWVFRNMECQFLNEEIMALYGKAYPVYRTGHGKTMWYWEARTSMESRGNVNEAPYSGYVNTEYEAKKIIETLLYSTETVQTPMV